MIRRGYYLGYSTETNCFQVDPQTCGKDAILGVDTYKQGEILGCCSRDGIITILDMNKNILKEMIVFNNRKR